MKNAVFPPLAAVFLLMVFAITPAVAADDSGTAAQPALSLLNAIFWAFIGVLLSFIIPVLAKYGVKVATLRKDNKTVDHAKEIVDAAVPYFFTAIQSFLIAIVVIAVLLSQGPPLNQWYVAFLAGYTFDATIQKVKAR
jgi:quinol-cytochrome oxidoreductase complex cytochrome b subunit